MIIIKSWKVTFKACHSCSCNILSGFLHYGLLGAALGEHLEASTGAECSCKGSIWCWLICMYDTITTVGAIQDIICHFPSPSWLWTGISDRWSAPHCFFLSNPVWQDGNTLSSISGECCLAMHRRHIMAFHAIIPYIIIILPLRD